MALPLTPSDHPDFQKNNPIDPNREFIVQMDCPKQEAQQTLKDIFNKHGHGKITNSLYTSTFFVKDMTWPLLNELRRRNDVLSCGPLS